MSKKNSLGTFHIMKTYKIVEIVEVFTDSEKTALKHAEELQDFSRSCSIISRKIELLDDNENYKGDLI